MKTFPDFTWEWIIEGYEKYRASYDAFVLEYLKDFDTLPEGIDSHVLKGQAIIDIVLKLRAHPQLEKLVPMKSMDALRWFPAENCQIILEYLGGKYELFLFRMDPLTSLQTRESKEVPFDQVADELYALIQKYRDDI